MREMGKAMMGTGEASGEKRAITAAEAAISNPLIDDSSMKGAKGVLISITGGKDLTLYEVDEAATRIREEVDKDANIIVGATFDESLEGIIRVLGGCDRHRQGRRRAKPAPAAEQRHAAALAAKRSSAPTVPPVAHPGACRKRDRAGRDRGGGCRRASAVGHRRRHHPLDAAQALAVHGSENGCRPAGLRTSSGRARHAEPCRTPSSRRRPSAFRSARACRGSRICRCRRSARSCTSAANSATSISRTSSARVCSSASPRG